jgi:hypothetical protein
MAGQINEHIRNFELLCLYQSGFKRHHTTTTAVLNLMDDIRLNLVMVNFTQAFDMIARDLMVCKMRGSQRFSDGILTALLGSFLSDRTQCVRSDGEYFMVRSIEYGVLQGSVSGPSFVYFIY